MPRVHSPISLLATALMVPLVVSAQVSPPAPQATGNITFHAEETFPESLVWSERQQTFFVGSFRKGVIGKVSPTGEYTPFASDERMVGSGGIKYDAKRNWVWAALCDVGFAVRTSPSTQGKLGAVIAFDAVTAKVQRYIDLAPLADGGHCTNDIAFDPAGNVYVTDSIAPVVYVIDGDFKPRVLVSDERFRGPNFNLNGIVYHPDGYLLVGKHNTGEFFRIELKPQVEIQPVLLPATLPGADGIELVDANTLLVAQNAGQDRAVQLKTKDGWKSAEVTVLAKSAVSFPTAITFRGKAAYMLNNRVDTLVDPAAKRASDYVLQLLPLGDGK
jgi:sugar lactone lactonase YvrE